MNHNSQIRIPLAKTNAYITGVIFSVGQSLQRTTAEVIIVSGKIQKLVIYFMFKEWIQVKLRGTF